LFSSRPDRLQGMIEVSQIPPPDRCSPTRAMD